MAFWSGEGVLECVDPKSGNRVVIKRGQEIPAYVPADTIASMIAKGRATDSQPAEVKQAQIDLKAELAGANEAFELIKAELATTQENLAEANKTIEGSLAAAKVANETIEGLQAELAAANKTIEELTKQLVPVNAAGPKGGKK